MPSGIRNNMRIYKQRKKQRRRTAMRTAVAAMKRGVHKSTTHKRNKKTKSAGNRSQGGGKTKKLRKQKKSKAHKKGLTKKHRPRYFHFMSL